MSTIRVARLEDCPVIASMAATFMAETPFAAAVDLLYLEAAAAVLCEQADVLLLVAEDDGGVCGFLLAQCAPSFLSPTVRLVEEKAWYVHPLARDHKLGQRLLVACEAWARHQGACGLILSALGQPGRLGEWYQTQGYTLLETHYLKELR